MNPQVECIISESEYEFVKNKETYLESQKTYFTTSYTPRKPFTVNDTTDYDLHLIIME